MRLVKKSELASIILMYMGYSVFLVAKTRDEDVEFRISKCESRKRNSLSENFTLFQSRDFENCELKQVEVILDIDLMAFQRYPVNYMPNTDKLEYQFYLAEEENDDAKMAEIQNQIEKVKTEWDLNYDKITKGWTLLSEMRTVIEALIQKIKEQPDFGKKVIAIEGWELGWDDYFSVPTSPQHRRGEYLIKDLSILLMQLDCMEVEGIEYVAFVG